MALIVKVQDRLIQPKEFTQQPNRLERDGPRIRWKSTLDVLVTADDGFIWVWPEKNLSICSPAPQTDHGLFRVSLKPQNLGEASFRLIVVREPDNHNQECVCRFFLTDPFHFPDRDHELDSSFAFASRETIIKKLLDSIASLLSNQQTTTPGKSVCEGIWLHGPLCSGKTTAVRMLCRTIGATPFVVLRESSLYQSPHPDSDLYRRLIPGELFSIDHARSKPAADHQSLLPVNDNALSGWVPESDVARLSVMRIDSRVLIRLNNVNEVPGKINDQILRHLGYPLSAGVNSARQIIDVLKEKRPNTHILIVLDEIDRVMSLNASIGNSLLQYLLEIVQEHARNYRRDYGLVLLVIDHLPPEERAASMQNMKWRSHELKLFEEPEVSAWLKVVLANPDATITPDMLLTHTGGHPLLMNLLLYVYLKKYGNARVGEPIILEDIVDQIRLKDFLERGSVEERVGMVLKWWISQSKIDDKIPNIFCSRLDASENVLLQALVFDRRIPAGARHAIKGLRSKGLVDDADGDPKVKTYLLKKLLKCYYESLGMSS